MCGQLALTKPEWEGGDHPSQGLVAGEGLHLCTWPRSDRVNQATAQEETLHGPGNLGSLIPL